MDHQAAGADIFAEGIHRRQSVLRKEVGDLSAPGQQHQIGCDQNAVGPDIIELLQSSLDLAGAADAENIEGDVQLLRGGPQVLHRGIDQRIGDVRQHGDRDTCGSRSLSSSSRLPSRSTFCAAKPVMLPPGRARLETMPTLTGSPMEPITTGIELVACLAASAAGVPWVTIKSTGSAVSSTAMAGKRSS